ncbi:hypothetical protein MMC15_008142 [Xylographa vitiligo]|nr:hypothetical protein [Xylographa vitiligo]
MRLILTTRRQQMPDAMGLREIITLREMDAEMNVARAEIGKDIAVAAVIDDVLDLQATVMQGRHVESRT